MAGQYQVYTLIYVTINNALLTQEGSCTMRRTTGSQPVHTVPNAYSGESPGSAMCEMEIESAVPLAAVEFDPTSLMQGLVPAEVAFVMAGKTYASKGFIYEDDYRHAVNQEAKQTLRFRGSFPQPK